MEEHSIITTRKRCRWWRRVSSTAVAITLVSSASVAWVHLRDDLRAVDADLTIAARDLDTSRVALIARYHRLTEARTALSSSRATLRRRTAERDAVEDRLIATDAALEDTKNRLGERSSELDRREMNLALLNRCFVGASNALNQIAVADNAGLAATLRDIRDVCAAAKADV